MSTALVTSDLNTASKSTPAGMTWAAGGARVEPFPELCTVRCQRVAAVELALVAHLGRKQ